MPATRPPSKARQLLAQQVERLGNAVGDLMRACQFRDRNEICCHGVSVSQCYALDALERRGPLAMGELATYLYLDVSTVTRLVDQLEDEAYIERGPDPADRRKVQVELTPAGSAKVQEIRSHLHADYGKVIDAIPEESREAVIAAVEELLAAFLQRSSCCADRQTKAPGLAESS